MATGRLLFIVGVFPGNQSPPQQQDIPMKSIIWTEWATSPGRPKEMTINVRTLQQLVGGSGGNVRFDVFKLHPSIQNAQQAQAILNDDHFKQWSQGAIAFGLHEVEVGWPDVQA